MNYELVYILTPKLAEADAKKKTADISSSIKKEADKIAVEDFWGKRELAYPIEKFTDGYYMVTQFSAEPEAVDKIDKSLRLDDEIIRFLLVKKSVLAKSKKDLRPSTNTRDKKDKEEKPAEDDKSESKEEKPKKEEKKTKKDSKKTKISDLGDKLDDIIDKGIDD